LANREHSPRLHCSPNYSKETLGFSQPAYSLRCEYSDAQFRRLYEETVIFVIGRRENRRAKLQDVNALGGSLLRHFPKFLRPNGTRFRLPTMGGHRPLWGGSHHRMVAFPARQAWGRLSDRLSPASGWGKARRTWRRAGAGEPLILVTRTRRRLSALLEPVESDRRLSRSVPGVGSLCRFARRKSWSFCQRPFFVSGRLVSDLELPCGHPPVGRPRVWSACSFGAAGRASKLRRAPSAGPSSPSPLRCRAPDWPIAPGFHRSDVAKGRPGSVAVARDNSPFFVQFSFLFFFLSSAWPWWAKGNVGTRKTPWDSSWTAAWRTDPDDDGAIGLSRCLEDFDLEDRAAEITTPTLVLRRPGEHDLNGPLGPKAETAFLPLPESDLRNPCIPSAGPFVAFRHAIRRRFPPPRFFPRRRIRAFPPRPSLTSVTV